MESTDARRPRSRHDRQPARIEDNLAAFPFPAFVVDPGGMVTAWNAAAETLFDLGHRAAIGSRLADLAIVDPMAVLLDQVKQVADGAASATMKDVRLARRSSAVQITISPLIGDESHLVGCVVTAEDCSVAEAFRRANEELQDAQRLERAKDDFLTMLAHELRNPLAPILSATYVIRRLNVSEPTLVAARRVIERQATHLARLVDDLLDVARVRQGRMELRRERLKLSDVTAEAVESVRSHIHAAGVRLSLAFPGGPILVEADRTRLVQVIVNLLNNATKYTGPGGEIVVAAAVEDRMAVLRISDTGIGIDRSILPHVFDLFVQADASLARSRGGLGIGLTLVRSIVEMHGGTVSAHSEGLGHGSLFVVRLPATPSVSDDAPPAAPAAASPRRLHFLVVEDNRDAREMLRAALELDGHRVSTAIDGPSGLREAQMNAPDVVLLDLGLPGSDGFETAEGIRRALGDSVRLVALTGYGDPQSRRRAVDAGFDLYVLKPVDPEELLRLVTSSSRS